MEPWVWITIGIGTLAVLVIILIAILVYKSSNEKYLREEIRQLRSEAWHLQDKLKAMPDLSKVYVVDSLESLTFEVLKEEAIKKGIDTKGLLKKDIIEKLEKLS